MCFFCDTVNFTHVIVLRTRLFNRVEIRSHETFLCDMLQKLIDPFITSSDAHDIFPPVEKIQRASKFEG